MWYVSENEGICFKPESESESVGHLARIWPDNGTIRGYLRGKEVYAGVNAKKAMEAVEKAYRKERKGAKG